MFGWFLALKLPVLFSVSQGLAVIWGAEHLRDKLAWSWQMLEEYLNESGELK